MVRSMHHTHFVLSEKEYNTLKNKARQSGLSMSGLLRNLIMGKRIRARPSDAIKELYMEINKIGVNINQVARNSNAGADPESCAAQALFLLKKVYVKMDRIADG